jgi:hypothetical protein
MMSYLLTSIFTSKRTVRDNSPVQPAGHQNISSSEKKEEALSLFCLLPLHICSSIHQVGKGKKTSLKTSMPVRRTLNTIHTEAKEVHTSKTTLIYRHEKQGPHFHPAKYARPCVRKDD